MKLIFKILCLLLIIITSFGILVAGLFTYWFIRPNTSYIHPDLDYETWDVETESPHNAFTDMVYWDGDFYLTFRIAPIHAPIDESEIVVMKSDDAKDWETVETFSKKGKDIRDSKLAVIKDRLFIYVVVREIENEDGREVTTSEYSYTDDGKDWEDLEDIEPEDKRFWRPKTYDNISWYCPIFEQGNVKLYNSTDGIDWDKISTIYDEPEADETDFAFLENGDILVSMRLQCTEAGGSSGCKTLLAVAEHPYDDWEYEFSELTRLDGPCIFNYSGDIYGVGRYQPERDSLFQQAGSALTKKRTALYYLEDDRVIYLSDLPSCGDTSYPAAVVKGKYLYVSYYTTDITRDYPWFIGMINPTKVRIAKIKLSSLEDIAEDLNELYDDGVIQQPEFPWVDYVVFFGLITLIGLYIFIIIKKFIIK